MSTFSNICIAALLFKLDIIYRNKYFSLNPLHYSTYRQNIEVAMT